ncbi:MAG: hypothetical protein D6819_10800 [Gammaproteobacteria bacterium]|nr:MAG: hypothetical protein D6819_10800 [Gammaproteobacteria bacterium]
MDILGYLSKAPELAQFCTQNGWIDNQSLKAEVLEEHPDSLLLAVTFDEVIMEGSGCEATRQPCYGRVRLKLDKGDIRGIETL